MRYFLITYISNGVVGNIIIHSDNSFPSWNDLKIELKDNNLVIFNIMEFSSTDDFLDFVKGSQD